MGKGLKAELSVRAALPQEPMANGCRQRSTSGRAAINHRAVIAPRSGRGSEGGSSLAPALRRGLIGRKFLHRAASPAKQLQEISFFLVRPRLRNQQLARKEGTGGSGEARGH